MAENAQNPLDVAYERMKVVRSMLGRAGYALGEAKKACAGIAGTEGFASQLDDVGAKVAYMLGDCISFCDNQQKRVDEERAAKIAELQRLQREKIEKEEAEKAELVRLARESTVKAFKEEPNKMAVAEDKKGEEAAPIAVKRRGRKASQN